MKSTIIDSWAAYMKIRFDFIHFAVLVCSLRIYFLQVKKKVQLSS